MPAFPNIYSGQQTANLTVTTTTERVAVTVAGVNTQPGGSPVRVIGMVYITTGAGTTSVTARIRRGTDTSGTLVGEANAVEVTAANTVVVPIEFEDGVGEVAGQSYVVTIQQTGATGNGTVLAAYALAVVQP